MKNLAILSFLLSLFLVSCGDDSGSSVGDLSEEAELSSSSSSKANKDSKFSSSSNVKNKSSSSSSKKAETITDDIQNWKDTTEGAIRKGDITDAIYIFNNKKWRVTTLPEASLGACNEKTVNFWGYVEERKMQDLNDPRKNECIDGYGICSVIVYSPGYYICLKNGQNKFYWDRIDVRYYEEYVDTRYYDYICNDPSYYANSKEGDAHWGNIEPVKKMY